MRIGMMADVYKPHVSGVTHYIELNKRQFERAGHKVFVFTFGGRATADVEERVVRSPGVPLGSTGYYFALRYTVAARRLLQTMDVAHIHHPFLSGQLALRYCAPRGIPMVFTNHTRYDLYAPVYLPILPGNASAGLLRAYMPSFCDAMDLVISPSAGTAAVLRGLGVASPIEIIPSGVQLQDFVQANPMSRAALGFNEGDILLVYAGRVATEKNLRFLLQAFAGVARVLDNVHLIVIGGGPKQIALDLHSLADKLRINGRLHFTGMVPYATLPAYLATCDAFVTASVTETFGLSIVEAFASGLPVLGISSPGISDLIEDSKTGYLTSEDQSAFTSKLTRLSSDAGLRKEMGRRAREASTRYAIENTSQLVLEQYQRLVSGRRPAKADSGIGKVTVPENDPR